MVYARASSAYRPGGPTTIIPGAGLPTSFGPDRIYDYEVGLKGSYFNRLLTVDLSVFHIDWHDIQLTENRGGLAVLTNGGRAKSQGVEASLVLAPAKGLSITAGGSYTDARLTEDSPLAGAVNGERIPETPHWNYSVDGSYDWSLGAGWNASIGGSYRHVGDRISDFTLNATSGLPAPRFNLGSYDVVDLRAGFSWRGWSLTAYVKNVGDERGILALAPITGDATQSPYTAAVLQPRTFGVDLAFSF
jgi:iron complex outermembrane receptor protein